LNLVIHLVWSVLIVLVFSLRGQISVLDLLLALSFGAGIDVDHLYHFFRNRGVRSILDIAFLRNYMEESKEPTTAPRYHTVLHELLGVAIVLAFSGYVFVGYSQRSAWIIAAAYLSHIALDTISIRMMPLSPFRKEEFCLGWIPPGSSRERRFLILSMAILIALCLIVVTNRS